MVFGLLNKIQLNHQINQTLEQMAQILFKSWFVDFEPVKAKIAARKRLQALQPENEPASPVCYTAEPDEPPALGDLESYMNRAAMQAISGKTAEQLDALRAEDPERYNELFETAALFPSAMQASELGEIPEGWVVAAITDFGKVVCGKTPAKKKADFYGDAIPFIKIPDMHENVFAAKTSDYLSLEGAASQPKKAIPKGSICVSCIATVGKVVIAAEDSHTNQQINSIVPVRESYTPYLYFRMQTLCKYLQDLASGGSATLNLNTGSFSKIRILMPSCSLLDAFNKKSTSFLGMILNNIHEAGNLCSLRDTLLPKLLSGELTPSEAEEAQPETTA